MLRLDSLKSCRSRGRDFTSRRAARSGRIEQDSVVLLLNPNSRAANNVRRATDLVVAKDRCRERSVLFEDLLSRKFGAARNEAKRWRDRMG
jgi:hypothetical protein